MTQANIVIFRHNRIEDELVEIGVAVITTPRSKSRIPLYFHTVA